MKRWIEAACAIAAAMAAGTVAAQPAPEKSTPYPTRPIRVVIPFPPAGTADTLARGVGLKDRQALEDQVAHVPAHRFVHQRRQERGGFTGGGDDHRATLGTRRRAIPGTRREHQGRQRGEDVTIQRGHMESGMGRACMIQYIEDGIHESTRVGQEVWTIATWFTACRGAWLFALWG